ncbi:MAG: hypothetical protein HY231_14425 [Acidobacteria bacterium]|nr:hypothetical protein [Acidobacteriota bacterium]
MLNDVSTHAAPQPEVTCLRFFGEFVSTELEKQYRQYVLAADKRQSRIALFCVFVSVIFFAYSDYLLFGGTPKFTLLVSLRGVAILLSVLMTWLLSKEITSRQFEIAFLSYLSLLGVFFVYVHSTRPPGYSSFAVLTVLTLGVMYLALPLPIHLQIIPAALISAGSLVLLVIANPLTDQLTRISIIFGIVCVNLVGVLASRQAHCWKRQQFAILLQETQLRQKLAQALDEIRTLRGIISICSYCKNIKTEPDDWEQIEAYVTTHTHARFSHGICPKCYDKHFAHIMKMNG